jgi:hypothetical protein
MSGPNLGVPYLTSLHKKYHCAWKADKQFCGKNRRQKDWILHQAQSMGQIPLTSGPKTIPQTHKLKKTLVF